MPAVDYFARRVPVAVVFGSFFLVLLPLLVLRLHPNFLGVTSYLAFFGTTVLGTGHFFITLALYLQSSHLDYFGQSARNRWVFFGIPALILLGVALLNAVPYEKGAYTLYFFFAVRFADFLHVGRQSYGVLQLFKRARPASLPAALRRLENAFFVAMAGLQWVTFAFGGRFPGDVVWMRAAVAVVAMAALVVVVAYARAALRPAGAHRPWTALGYFAIQAFAAGLAVYRTELYVIALTVHYAEYHVIMAPRCFRTALDSARPVDRAFGCVRARPWLFYGLLVGVVLLFELRSEFEPKSGVPLRVLVHLFDGIFLLHYFVDAFLWKFRDPWVARTLGPLYFGRAADTQAPATAVGQSGNGVGWGGGRGLLGAAGALGLLALSWGSLGLVDSIHARHHRRWGLDYARGGQLPEARRHLSEALAHAPDDREIKRALEWVDSRLAAGR